MKKEVPVNNWGLVPSAWSCLLMCVAVIGCRSRDYEIAPVSGRITFDQKPVEGLHVTFQPQAEGKKKLNPGLGSYAVTDADGRYRLALVEAEEPGAVVGSHRVRFCMRSEMEQIDDAGKPLVSLLPPRYRDGSVTFTVPPEGTDEANFDLSSKP